VLLTLSIRTSHCTADSGIEGRLPQWEDGQRLKVDGPGMLQKAELAVDRTGPQAAEDRAFSGERSLLPETQVRGDFRGKERCFSRTAPRKASSHASQDGARSKGRGDESWAVMPVADHARMVGCATAVSIVWRKRRDARGFFLVWCGCVLCLVEFHFEHIPTAYLKRRKRDKCSRVAPHSKSAELGLNNQSINPSSHERNGPWLEWKGECGCGG
jgi:hypothetical protein